MTTYTKSTDFAVKDLLLTGNPNKLVKGSEVDVEFANLELSDATSVKRTSNSGSAVLPSGTTAQRDATPAIGYARGNTTTGILEWWNGTNWTSPTDASAVTFIQSGIGAVARTVQDKARESVSVEDFGAVGDGVTDDTAAIQAALNSGAGLVWLPKGTYKVSSSLVVPPYMILVGDGDVSVINYTGSGTAISFQGPTTLGVGTTYRSVLRNFQVKTTTGATGVKLRDVAEVELDGIAVTGFSGSGVNLCGTPGTGGCIIISIHNCDINYNLGHGIYSSEINAINQISIHDNHLSGNQGNNISWQAGGLGLSIIGNDIEGAAGNAELLLEATVAGCVINGNYFETAGAHPAIRCSTNQATYGLTIMGNNIGAGVAYAYAIEIATNVFVYGLQFSGNSIGGLFTYAIGNAGAGPALSGAQIGPNNVTSPILPSQSLRGSGVRVNNASNYSALSYSSSMTPNLSLGNTFEIAVPNAGAFTINNPLSSTTDATLTLSILNVSGGATGAITWGANFKMSTWNNAAYPGSGYRRMISFVYNGTHWVETFRSNSDIPV